MQLALNQTYQQETSIIIPKLLGEWVKLNYERRKLQRDYINSFLTSYYSSKLDINIYFLHWLIDTSGRKNDFSTAHGVCKGKEDFHKEATKYFDDFRSLILEYLQEVEKKFNRV